MTLARVVDEAFTARAEDVAAEQGQGLGQLVVSSRRSARRQGAGQARRPRRVGGPKLARLPNGRFGRQPATRSLLRIAAGSNPRHWLRHCARRSIESKPKSGMMRPRGRPPPATAGNPSRFARARVRVRRSGVGRLRRAVGRPRPGLLKIRRLRARDFPPILFRLLTRWGPKPTRPQLDRRFGVWTPMCCPACS